MADLHSFEAKLPLATVALDRDYLARNRAEHVSDLLANDSTLVLPMNRSRVLLHTDHSLKLVPPAALPIAEIWIYLGKRLADDASILLAVVSDEVAALLEPDSNSWHELRKSGIGLSTDDAAIFTQALALANWHENHKFCPACGAVTEVERSGWVRRCVVDGRELFPRTDPAIIVAVIDDQERILLGSQGVWEENRFSILAGFVEPGESLGAAVVREMQEEAGILVAEPDYLGSQAWPFPFSLMLGFTAKYVQGVATPDGDEIVKLRWFTRDELKAEASELILPGKLTIARFIIEHWLGEELETGS